MLAHPVTRHAIASAIVHDATAIDSQRLVAALDGLGAPGVRPVLDAGLRYDARSRAPQGALPDAHRVGQARQAASAVDG
jgi:hypothetical protein